MEYFWDIITGTAIILGVLIIIGIAAYALSDLAQRYYDRSE